MKKAIAIILVSLVMILLCACGKEETIVSEPTSNQTENSIAPTNSQPESSADSIISNQPVSSKDEESEASKEQSSERETEESSDDPLEEFFTLTENPIDGSGGTIQFRGIEYKFDNFCTPIRYSESETKNVILIQIGAKITNITDESQLPNFLYYRVYGADRIQSENYSSYLAKEYGATIGNNCIDFSSELAPSESDYRYFYLLYNGDGKYSIVFNDLESEKITLDFFISLLGEIPTSDRNKYGPGETFTFDGLEITLDTSYTIVQVDNRYSDKNGKEVIMIGAVVKNTSISKNKLGMFDFKLFGSKGVELDGVSSYFDEAIDNAGSLKQGGAYHKYFYLLYDGDGTYSVDFENYSDEKSVEFTVSAEKAFDEPIVVPYDELPSFLIVGVGVHTPGETFTFDGLEITLDSDYSFTKVENRYSENNGKDVVRVGATVKNVSAEKNKLSIFDIELFGSKGSKLSDISSYFDDAIDYAGELKPDGEYHSYFYLLYDGDGIYSIDFENYSESESVEFKIVKE